MGILRVIGTSTWHIGSEKKEGQAKEEASPSLPFQNGHSSAHNKPTSALVHHSPGYDFDMEYESTHAEMEKGDWLSYLTYKQEYPDEEALIASVTVEEDRHCRSFDGAILKTISIFPKIQIQKLYLEEN